MKTRHSLYLFTTLVFTLFVTRVALAQTSHFTPPQGNPFLPMNIFIIGARYDGLNMAVNDEIGVFDSTLCVGAAVFTGLESIANPLEVKATKDDGTANGFTDGNEIIFKLWDTSAQQELSIRPDEVQFFDPITGNSIDPVPFCGLETAAVFITVTSGSSISPMKGEAIPKKYRLDQNYPNPFNPSTSISYALPEPSHIRIDIFDLNGNLVKNLQYRRQSIGHHTIDWDGTNSFGERVATGIYFYRLTSSKFTEAKKMIFAK